MSDWPPPRFNPVFFGMAHRSSGRDGFGPAPAAVAAQPAFAINSAPAPPTQVPFGVAAPAFGVAAPAFGAAPAPPAQAAHPGVSCDVCGTVPILGVRHKCASCPDWDCCSVCLASGRMETSLDAFSCRHEVLLGVRNPAKTLLAAPPIQATDDGATITVTATYAAAAAAPAPAFGVGPLPFGAAPDGSFGDGQSLGGAFGGGGRGAPGGSAQPTAPMGFAMMFPTSGRVNGFATMDAEKDGEGRTTDRNV